MKKINLFVLFLSLMAIVSCEKNEEVLTITQIDYVSFQADFNRGVDAAITTDIDVNIYTSTTSTSERTVNIGVDATQTTLDASAYSTPATVTIPANSNVGTFTVSIDGPNVGSGGVVVLDFSTDNNVAFTGDALTMTVFPVCFDNTPNLTLTLDITFDDWPEEIYWRIQDGTGAFIAESAPGAFGAYGGLTGGISQDFCLSDGDYTFVIFDQFGDGAGAYTLTFNDGTVVHESDGGYGGGENVPFSLGN